MNGIKLISTILVPALLAGCATPNGIKGSNGPKVVSSGYATEAGSYAEVGIQFSTMGDFVAVFSPERWKNPVETGGSLSWVNPMAWSDDGGRTGRILLGQAALVGGAVIAAVAANNNNDNGAGAVTTTGGGGGSTPPPPTGGPSNPPPTPGG